MQLPPSQEEVASAQLPAENWPLLVAVFKKLIEQGSNYRQITTYLENQKSSSREILNLVKEINDAAIEKDEYLRPEDFDPQFNQPSALQPALSLGVTKRASLVANFVGDFLYSPFT